MTIQCLFCHAIMVLMKTPETFKECVCLGCWRETAAGAR